MAENGTSHANGNGDRPKSITEIIDDRTAID